MYYNYTRPRAYNRRGHATVHEQNRMGGGMLLESTVISKNRFLLNRVLCKVQVADSYK